MFHKMPPPRRSSRLKPLPHPFWTTADVVSYMLQFLSLINLVEFSHIDRRCQLYAKTHIKGRITRYTSPFFTKNVAIHPSISTTSTMFTQFFQTLDETRSWVVGSVALAAASVLSDPPCPTNLNVITHCCQLGNWLRFLLVECGFRVVKREWSSGPYASAGLLRFEFKHLRVKTYSVVITMTRDRSLGALFFASPNTDQLVAIASYELITPVLENVSEQQHLKGWRSAVHRDPGLPAVPQHPAYRDVPRFPGVTTLDTSTSSWTRPCRWSCPGIWRYACGLDGFAHIKWGGLDDLDDYTDPTLLDLGRGRMTFRFGVRCENTLCKNSPNLLLGFSMMEVYDTAYQIRVQRTIEQHQPLFTCLYNAILYGAGATSPSIVLVPLRLGLETAESPDDLDVTWWIPPGEEPNTATVDLDATRLKVTHWPFDSVTPLPCAFTICVAPQLRPGDDPNSLDVHPINDLFAEQSHGWMVPHRGNVLVVKHEGQQGVGNMELEDAPVVDLIVKRRLAINICWWPNATQSLRVRYAKMLLAVMDGEGACIVGSSAQGLLCFAAADDGLEIAESRDLNILANEANLPILIRLFRDEFGLDDWRRLDDLERSEYRGLVSNVYTFRRVHRCRVTISCTISASVLNVLLASRTTSQMSALSRTHFMSFYPHMTRKRMGLLAWPAVAEKKLDYLEFPGDNLPAFAPYASVHSNTAKFKHLCGWSCPRLWRQVAGLRGVGVYTWSLAITQCPSRTNDTDYLDIVRYSHVGRQARAVVQAIISLRCVKLLLPYFDNEETRLFWHALDKGHGGITGSGALWITKSAPSWHPQDLNTVVGRNRAMHLQNVLRDSGWTERSIAVRVPVVLQAQGYHRLRAHPSSEDGTYANCTWIYTKTGKHPITVTETVHSSVFQHIAEARHTMATMLLTSSTLISLHRFECASGIATWRDGWDRRTMEHVEAARRVLLMGGTDAYFSQVTGECGSWCPGIVRRLRGGTGVGLLAWKLFPHQVPSTERRDASDTEQGDSASCREETVDVICDIVARDAYDGFMRQRYAFGWTWCRCTNEGCSTFLFPRDLVPTVPVGKTLSSNPKD
ncbi:hypothetical protein B0H13DRAFT_1886467 [Mycena leptocephala]|nr:hypothetical protein B0H13DRAFT_1886467 [Mycena leptocephala]